MYCIDRAISKDPKGHRTHFENNISVIDIQNVEQN